MTPISIARNKPAGPMAFVVGLSMNHAKMVPSSTTANGEDQ